MKKIQVPIFILIVFLFTGCMASSDKEIYSRLEQEVESGFIDIYEELELEKTYYMEDDLELIIHRVSMSVSESGLLSLQCECTLNNLLDKDNFVETIFGSGWLRIKYPSTVEEEISDFPDGCTFGGMARLVDENGKEIGYLKPKECLTATLKIEELVEKEYLKESIKNNGKAVGYLLIGFEEIGCWMNLNHEAIMRVL